MIQTLVALALGVSTQVTPADQEAQLRSLITQSNNCLKREVDMRIAADKVRLSDIERSTIRRAAATECDQYNREIAKFTRSKGKTPEQVEEDMLMTSLQIADAMAMLRVKSNAESAK